MDKNQSKMKKLYETALKEMFKRVGEKYPNPKITDQPEWYLLRSWTPKEEKSFGDWLAEKIAKAFPHLTKYSVNKEVVWFLLDYGWTTVVPVEGKCAKPLKKK